MGPTMSGLPKQASLSSKQPTYSTQQQFNQFNQMPSQYPLTSQGMMSYKMGPGP